MSFIHLKRQVVVGISGCAVLFRRGVKQWCLGNVGLVPGRGEHFFTSTDGAQGERQVDLGFVIS